MKINHHKTIVFLSLCGMATSLLACASDSTQEEPDASSELGTDSLVFSDVDTDTDADGDSDSDADGDSDTDADGDSDTDADGDSDTDSDSDADSDTDADGDSDSDADGDSDTDADGDSDSDADADSDMDADGDSDTDSDSDSDSDTGSDGDSDTDSDGDSDTGSDSDSNTGTETVTETDSNGETDADMECSYECTWSRQNCEVNLAGIVVPDAICTGFASVCCDTTNTGDTDTEIDTGSDQQIDTGTGQDTETDTNGDCTANGGITYSLNKADNPTADQQAAYDLITEAMDTAVWYYNCYTDLEKTLTVQYNPTDVPTADGNINGSIRFGQEAYMNHITAMHEISHTVGIGYYNFYDFVVDEIFTGENATAQLREITGTPDDLLYADTQHFWPYGLNRTSEVSSEEDLISHCKMVIAILKDMGRI